MTSVKLSAQMASQTGNSKCFMKMISFNCAEQIKINDNSKQKVSKFFVYSPSATWESYFQAWPLQEHKLVSASSHRQDNTHFNCTEFSSQNSESHNYLK